MEKFQKTGKRLNKTLEQLRNECVEYLNSVLTENMEIYLCEDEDCFVYVTYDGGRHPEYNSSAFSLVQSVSVVNSEIVLNLEDEDEVSIDRIETLDLYNVCDLISDIL